MQDVVTPGGFRGTRQVLAWLTDSLDNTGISLAWFVSAFSEKLDGREASLAHGLHWARHALASDADNSVPTERGSP